MRGLKRWIFVAPIAAFIVDVAVANDDPVTPDVARANAALAQAEVAVKQADVQRALWTSAENALRKARRALQEGDMATTVEQARIAQKHSELGIAQKSYPLFR